MSSASASGVRSVVRTRTSEYYVRDDGIIVQAVDTPGKMTLDDARANVRLFEELAEGLVRRLMVDMQVPYTTEPGVREFYASDEASRYVAAIAMVTPSTASRILGNLLYARGTGLSSFLKLNQPRYPCRMFGSVEQAAEWLLRQPADR